MTPVGCFGIFCRLKAFWMLLPLVGAARAAREVSPARKHGWISPDTVHSFLREKDIL